MVSHLFRVTGPELVDFMGAMKRFNASFHHHGYRKSSPTLSHEYFQDLVNRVKNTDPLPFACMPGNDRRVTRDELNQLIQETEHTFKQMT